MDDKLKKLKDIIKANNNIVFFGGAGVSTESDIPDFRSAAGLYNKLNDLKYSPEYMLSHSCFQDHKEEFYKFYINNILFPNAKPNLAHIALTRLESQGKLRAIITQNIDGLHQLSGSKEVLELHGNVLKNYCTNCGKKFPIDYILQSNGVPICDATACYGTIRPDVVLYEEALDESVMDKAIDYIRRADVLIIGGTSLVVYPSAGLIRYFKGSELVLINKSSTPMDHLATLSITDKIGSVLDAVID